MRLKQSTIGLLIGLSCIVLLLGILLWPMIGLHEVRCPTDLELTSLFRDHHQAFEELKGMALVDGPITSFISKETLSGSKISKQRQEVYQRLLTEINPAITVGVDYDDKVRLCFAIDAVSAIGPGWVKGIEYLPGDVNREGVVLKDLDDPRKMPAGVYLKPIEPKWFLFFQRDE